MMNRRRFILKGKVMDKAKEIPKSKKSKAQAIVEFALVLPVLL